MELQRETNHQSTTKETLSVHHHETKQLSAIDEGINQISQAFWQELNEMKSAEYPLLGMWK